MDRRTEEIYGKVKNYIEKYHMLNSGDSIVAGVSGGADSVCLLLILWELSKEIDFRLLTVHVHHGVRDDADCDADYVEQLCSKLGVPFFLKKVDMSGYAKEKGLSQEEAGRQLRYQAFEEVVESDRRKGRKIGSYKIAVAHNNNDRAETMLFHLFRGSGLRGLVGIRPVREQIIRPLLCLDRTEIEAYLAERNIAFCIDSTNDEDTYTRNKIRHHILPYAENQICNNVAAHMGNTADILAETEDFVQEQTTLAYERCLMDDACGQKGQQEWEGPVRSRIVLNLTSFRKESSFLQKMVLLRCMEELTPHRKDITKEHIEALLELTNKSGSKEFNLPYDLTAYKEYDRLILHSKKEENGQKADSQKQEYLSIPVLIPGEVNVPGLGILEFRCMQEEEFFYKKGQIIPEKTYTKWFDYDKITTTLLLRTRKMGDYLTIDSALRKKSIKEYMVNEKIPKTQRENIYLLADGSHVLWIPGYRISQFYKVNENTKCILQVQLRGGNNG